MTAADAVSRPRLALASNNRGKVAEFQSLLGNEVEIVSLADLGLESPEETGETFEANAELKARYVHDRTGLVTLADDSGLVVDALGGAPGVRSARFAGERHDDADNRRKLIEVMDSIPDSQRSAHFVAAIAIVDATGTLAMVRGTCDGTIMRAERGVGGFGYDSLFALPDGRTMAELSPAEKNAVSHRGNAVRLALPNLQQALGIEAGTMNGDAP